MYMFVLRYSSHNTAGRFMHSVGWGWHTQTVALIITEGTRTQSIFGRTFLCLTWMDQDIHLHKIHLNPGSLLLMYNVSKRSHRHGEI
ncbi:hypothetical protein FKM82_028348 [Ascaphus truei]